MNLEGDIFEMNFLNEFEELSKDKVKNVRMLVAKVLQKHLRKNGSIKLFIIGRLRSNERIQNIMENFEKDTYIRHCLNYKFHRESLSPLFKSNTQKE